MHIKDPETILIQITQQHGITILAHPRLKGLILDLMPTAERKYINVMKRAIDDQIGARLMEMQQDDTSVRQIKINTLKEKFKNDNALDDTAYYIVDCFVNALGWNTTGPKIVLSFKEVKIGDQIWADRNLDVSHFRNGEPIPEAKTNEEWIEAGENKQPAWCYYDNDTENGEKYGKLYNWYAVNDPRGLAPEGWHVPYDFDWSELIKYLGEEAETKLKSKTGWSALVNRNNEKIRIDEGNGTDEVGFTALPGGHRIDFGLFRFIENSGYWWSATEYDSFNARYSVMYSEISRVKRSYDNKSFGIYVRCLRASKLNFKAIKIGNQIWANRNLDVSHFRNGDPIPEARTKIEWVKAGENKQPAWCYCNNDPGSDKIYGKLYNWFAINDSRGLSPEGWHVPSETEWKKLSESIGDRFYWFKLMSTKGWAENMKIFATDEFGFSAYPCGERDFEGRFLWFGTFGYFWSSSEKSEISSWKQGFDNASEHNFDDSKKLGLSVRCICDEERNVLLLKKIKDDDNCFWVQIQFEDLSLGLNTRIWLEATEEKFNSIPDPVSVIQVPSIILF